MTKKQQKIDSKFIFFLSFFIFLGFIFTFLYALSFSKSLDQKPPISSITPDKNIQFGNEISPVNVGFLVKSFSEVDMNEGLIELEGEIWFKFKQSDLSLDQVSRYQFENGTIIEKRPTTSYKVEDSILSVFYTKVRFHTFLDHHFFPLSNHKVFLMLKIPGIQSNEIRLEAKRTDFLVGKGMYPSGWKIKDHKVYSGYMEDHLTELNRRDSIFYPGVLFEFSFERPGVRQALVIFGPILFLFYLGLLSLVVQGSSQMVIGMVVGSLSGQVIQRIVIDKLSPQVGYFTLADHFYFSVAGLTFLVFCLASVDIIKPVNATLKKTFFCGFQIIGLTYILHTILRMKF